MKDVHLSQFLMFNVNADTVPRDTFFPPGWFSVVDALLRSPSDDMNRFQLTWEIMELSRRGYHDLFIHGKDISDSQSTFLTLLRLSLRKYPESLEFLIALAFADLAIGQYFNGTAVLERVCDDIRVGLSYRDTIRQRTMECVGIAISKESSKSHGHFRAMRTSIYHLQPSARLAEVKGFDRVLALMWLKPPSEIARTMTPHIHHQASIQERIKLDSVEALVNNHWGPLGQRVLEAFISVLSKLDEPDDDFTVALYEFTEQSPRLRFSRSSRALFLSGQIGLAEWQCMVSCLQWLSLIFDEAKSGSALITRRSESRRTGSAHGPETEEYVAHDSHFGALIENLGTSELCWTSLFQGGYIGEHVSGCFSFLVDNEDEPDAHGLRVPYDILLSASSIDYITKIDGTPVLCNFQNALVPIRRFDSSGSIQWHLMMQDEETEALTDDDERFRWLAHSQELADALPEERMRDVPLDQLMGIAYVGYCSSPVKIKLGEIVPPRTLPQSNFRYRRDLKYTPSGRDVRVSIGVGGPGPVNASIGVGRAYQATHLINRFTPPKDFGIMVDKLYTRHVIVYSHETQTALLSKLINLMISLSRAYLQEHNYPMFDDDLFSFPHGIEGSESRIRHLGSTSIEEEFTFAKLLKNLAFTYSALYSLIPPNVGGIVGFELADIINNSDDFYAKEIPSTAGIRAWLPLAHTIDVALGWDIRQMVELMPSSTGRPLCAIDLPLGSDNLVAPIQTLRKVFERTQSRTDIRREFTSNLFACSSPEECDGRICGSGRLQRVKFGTGRLQRRHGAKHEKTPAWLDDVGIVCFGCNVLSYGTA